jgi:RNA recognition motif-containing protein
MSIKLFVGGLNYSTDSASLRRGFEHFGEVDDVAVINDRDTGRSRGFGFVTFAERAAGERAIQEMDGSELDGRTLRVNEATERAPRGGGSFGGGGGGPSGKGRSRRGDRSERW